MIKSILELLGLSHSEGESAPEPEPESTVVREISARLKGLGEDRARYMVIFAMVLARAARADLEISDNERWVIVQILREHAGLPEEQAELAVEMVAYRNQLFGVTEDYAATRLFKDMATDDHLECMLRCLFAVCAADDSISLVEGCSRLVKCETSDALCLPRILASFHRPQILGAGSRICHLIR